MIKNVVVATESLEGIKLRKVSKRQLQNKLNRLKLFGYRPDDEYSFLGGSKVLFNFWTGQLYTTIKGRADTLLISVEDEQWELYTTADAVVYINSHKQEMYINNGTKNAYAKYNLYKINYGYYISDEFNDQLPIAKDLKVEVENCPIKRKTLIEDDSYIENLEIHACEFLNVDDYLVKNCSALRKLKIQMVDGYICYKLAKNCDKLARVEVETPEVSIFERFHRIGLNEITNLRELVISGRCLFGGEFLIELDGHELSLVDTITRAFGERLALLKSIRYYEMYIVMQKPLNAECTERNLIETSVVAFRQPSESGISVYDKDTLLNGITLVHYDKLSDIPIKELKLCACQIDYFNTERVSLSNKSKSFKLEYDSELDKRLFKESSVRCYVVNTSFDVRIHGDDIEEVNQTMLHTNAAYVIKMADIRDGFDLGWNIYRVWTLGSGSLGTVDCLVLNKREVLYVGDVVLKGKAYIKYHYGNKKITGGVWNNRSLKGIDLNLAYELLNDSSVLVKNCTELEHLHVRLFKQTDENMGVGELTPCCETYTSAQGVKSERRLVVKPRNHRYDKTIKLATKCNKLQRVEIVLNDSFNFEEQLSLIRELDLSGLDNVSLIGISENMKQAFEKVCKLHIELKGTYTLGNDKMVLYSVLK